MRNSWHPRLVQIAAERDRVKITNKGDWSFFADKLLGDGLEDEALKYGKAKKK